MAQPSRLRFLVLALPFVMAIALLAAIQPRLTTASAVPAAFFRGHPVHQRGEVNSHFRERYRPGQGPVQQPIVSVASPEGGYTVDGGRLLAAFALAGAFTGLIWLTIDNGTPAPTQNIQRTLMEQDIARLREELNSLHLEQRHLREALDWQGRLLTGEPGPPADT
jgi:hypothetical protein